MKSCDLISLFNFADSGDTLSIQAARLEAIENGFRPKQGPDAANYLIRLMTAAITGDRTYLEAVAMATKVMLNCRHPSESLAFRMFLHRSEPPKLQMTCGMDSAHVVFDFESGYFRHVNGTVNGRGGCIIEILHALNYGLTVYSDRNGNQYPIELTPAIGAAL
jgi:hypothetical protein